MPRSLIGLALATSALVLTAAATPGSGAAPFGPPWISIEYPPSPYDRTTRDAFLLVHAFHHGTPINLPVSGSAEGIVSGRRRSLPLRFTPTSREGVFALTRQWGLEGTWSLVISVSQGGPDDAATAVVDLGSDGRVASVRVPTEKRAGYEIPAPRRVTMEEVERALLARAGALARSR
jgi:hypothetical protein